MTKYLAACATGAALFAYFGPWTRSTVVALPWLSHDGQTALCAALGALLGGTVAENLRWRRR